jgi:hypothetical protein
MTSRVQAFTLSGYSGLPTQGTVTVQEFSRDERVRRALAGLGKWWGIALGSVFIPVAHFILVPSFVLYGMVQFAQRLATVTLATDAHGTCPDCHAEQTLEVAARWHVPQAVTCRSCHRGLQLS